MDFSIRKGVLQKCYGISENIIIPEGVRVIRNMAFNDIDISSVVIPKTVETIEFRAFCHCLYLSNVTFQNSKTSIHEQSFFRCRELKDIYIEDLSVTVHSIPDFQMVVGGFIPRILKEYVSDKDEISLNYIRRYFYLFMKTAIEQNDIEAVQKFTEVDGLFTPENIKTYLHQCIDNDKTEILMILLDCKANLPKS